MRIIKRVAGLTVATSVAAAGLVAVAAPAHADDFAFGEHALIVPFGESVTIPFEGCRDASRYPQVTLVYYAEGAPPETQQLNAGASSVTVSSGIGTTGISITCQGATADIATLSGQTEIFAPSSELIASGPWVPKQPVTLSAEFLQPGESATLALVDRLGQLAPRDLGTSIADDTGLWTQTLTVPSDLPEDYYHLRLTTASGKTFYGTEQRWGDLAPVRRLTPVIEPLSTKVDPGATFTLYFSGCQGPERIWLISSSVAAFYPDQELPASSTSVDLTALRIPVTYRVLCLDLDGRPWLSDPVTAVPYSTYIAMDNPGVIQGESVTLSAEGFTPRERVRLTLQRSSTGEIVWQAKASRVMADGTWTKRVTVPTALDPGYYRYILIGNKSGVYRESESLSLN